MAYYISLQDKAYDYLKEMIANGEIKPGEFYSEAKMATEIGMSRTPFKDALTRLSQQKYIDIVPSKGFCMHIMNDRDIEDTYQIRCAMESFSAMHLHRIKNSDDGKDAIYLMEKYTELMDEALAEEQPNSDKFYKYDILFHKTLLGASKNSEMMRTFDSFLHFLTDISFKSFALQEGRIFDAAKEHHNIIDQIKTDDENEAIKIYETVRFHTRIDTRIVRNKK